jgi:polysaccharide biosynthesis protein PelA
MKVALRWMGAVAVAAGAWSGSSVAPGSAQGASPQPVTVPDSPATSPAVPSPAPLATDVAFCDAADVPVDALAFFPLVVLNADRAPPAAVRALAAAGSHPIARLAWPSGGSPEALLAPARRLAVAGYEGALLEVAAKGPPTPQAVAQASRALRTVWPRGSLLLAGDPHLATDAAPELSGVVVTGAVARAAELAAFARQALAGRSGPVPVIDVESVPAGRRAQARELAQTLAHAGVVPWVRIGGDDGVGLGAIEPVPRRILVVRDGAEEPNLAFTVAHRLLALPLEYLGYVVDYADARGPLPGGNLAARYAAVATWFTDDDLPAADRYEKWLSRQLDSGLKVAIFDHLGFRPSAGLLARLGLVTPRQPPQLPLRISSDDWIGFEAGASPRSRDLPAWDAPGLTRHLELVDAAGHRLVAVAHGAWGGLALAPYVTSEGVQGRQRWIVDPFRFLAGALALPAIPVPDPTTTNGRRVMEIHIDGDGFVSTAELPDHPFAGEVIRRELLARYDWPTTVSVIEGEIGPEGLYPDKSAALEAIARRIFSRPEVEIASHSYSHPFDWVRAGRPTDAAAERADDDHRDGDRLQIPGYVYSLAREIDGSVGYINSRLAPPGKSTRVFLWSGDALPPEEALQRTDALSLENVNGDNAEEPGVRPTLAQVPSFVRPVGARTQIYAPAQNENVYTNLWHGPYYGFRRIIDYFQFTDAPRRLKPIGIYYHFFSGTKAAAVKALHDVYAWAAEQETFPVWVSEYAAGVRGFERATLARRLDGGWLVHGLGALATLRLPAALGWPDLEKSEGVVGVRDLPQGHYVALEPGRAVSLVLTPAAPHGPYVLASNAAIASFRRLGGDTIRFHLRGHVPVEAEIGGCSGSMSVRSAHAGPPAAISVKGLSVRSPGPDTGELDVSCH